jgi:hypothetical protein
MLRGQDLSRWNQAAPSGKLSAAASATRQASVRYQIRTDGCFQGCPRHVVMSCSWIFT